MSARTVTTQAELDAALADAASEILIDSPRGVWIKLRASGSATVRASGSATVEAYGLGPGGGLRLGLSWGRRIAPGAGKRKAHSH